MVEFLEEEEGEVLEVGEEDVVFQVQEGEAIGS